MPRQRKHSTIRVNSHGITLKGIIDQICEPETIRVYIFRNHSQLWHPTECKILWTNILEDWCKPYSPFLITENSVPGTPIQ
ncbi:2113_t:CDS:2, partial [Cetraspora pellucida]